MTSPRPALDSQLLVASAGGHLHEMLLLRDRFEPAARTTHWVTYGTADAQARLAGERVTVCHHPTHRNVPNALRNLRLAERVLRRLRPDRVVSTGAGVAVPFLMAASRRGIPGHYIESAARVEGPSLSGRLVRRLTSASTYTQHPGWHDGRSRYLGDVFERFTPSTPRGVDGDRPLKIAVSLGTHVHPFDRLVRALDAALDPADEVVAQMGSTQGAPAHWEVHGLLPTEELGRRFATADVVVCHAGVGLALTALDVGRAPIISPRLAQYGEHVDDHQQQLAKVLGDRGLARVVAPEDLDRATLLRQAGAGVLPDAVEPGALHLD